jgi:hypothetical protein
VRHGRIIDAASKWLSELLELVEDALDDLALRSL